MSAPLQSGKNGAILSFYCEEYLPKGPHIGVSFPLVVYCGRVSVGVGLTLSLRSLLLHHDLLAEGGRGRPAPLVAKHAVDYARQRQIFAYYGHQDAARGPPSDTILDSVTRCISRLATFVTGRVGLPTRNLIQVEVGTYRSSRAW